MDLAPRTLSEYKNCTLIIVIITLHEYLFMYFFLSFCNERVSFFEIFWKSGSPFCPLTNPTVCFVCLRQTEEGENEEKKRELRETHIEGERKRESRRRGKGARHRRRERRKKKEERGIHSRRRERGRVHGML